MRAANRIADTVAAHHSVQFIVAEFKLLILFHGITSCLIGLIGLIEISLRLHRHARVYSLQPQMGHAS